MMRQTILSCAAMLAFAFAASAQTPPPGHPSGFAVVDKDGNLIRGRNAIAATRLNAGIYEVDFSGSVKKCVFTASTGLPIDGSNVAGFVTVAGRGSNDDGVYVQTFDATGVSSDRGFHLIVRC
ncbi:MAG TPA: hypothetical protein VHZ29_13475 [Rhizomicrobium sp.]|jgi:hypothetical protein|nr:hypothetical protein [Rhizomicrobium sp.]